MTSKHLVEVVVRSDCERETLPFVLCDEHVKGYPVTYDDGECLVRVTDADDDCDCEFCQYAKEI